MGSINFTTGVRELKFGESFTNPNSKKTFHTLKYDFKPACVDEKKPALLEIGPDKQVTVTVPNLDGSEEPNTVFKGSQRNYSKKDCVLVINKLTGEITLERLSTNIQVKKTRNESKVTKPPPQQITAANISARQHSRTKITTGSRKKTPIGLVSKRSPPQNTPSSPIVGQDPTLAVTSTDSINNLPKEAMNNNSNPNNNHHHPYNNHQPKANVKANPPSGVMSLSSSSSSSSSSDDSSSSDNSSSSDSSSSSGSDSDSNSDSMSDRTTKHPTMKSTVKPTPPDANFLNFPCSNLSDSDSD